MNVPGPCSELRDTPARAAANYCLALGQWRPRETEARGEIVGVVAEEVLKVVAHAERKLQLRAHADAVFNKRPKNFFEEDTVPAALLDQRLFPACLPRSRTT